MHDMDHVVDPLDALMFGASEEEDLPEDAEMKTRRMKEEKPLIRMPQQGRRRARRARQEGQQGKEQSEGCKQEEGQECGENRARPRQREKAQAEANAQQKAKAKSLLRDKVKSMKIKELWDTLPETVQKEVAAMSRDDRTAWTNEAVVRAGGRLFLDEAIVTEVLNRTKRIGISLPTKTSS